MFRIPLILGVFLALLGAGISERGSGRTSGDRTAVSCRTAPTFIPRRLQRDPTIVMTASSDPMAASSRTRLTRVATPSRRSSSGSTTVRRRRSTGSQR